MVRKNDTTLLLSFRYLINDFLCNRNSSFPIYIKKSVVRFFVCAKHEDGRRLYKISVIDRKKCKMHFCVQENEVE